MSEATKKQLIETLTALNRDEKVWAINFLVQNLAGISTRKKRLARKLHDEGFDDEQWEAYFQGEGPVNLPQETEPLSNLLKASVGKTIKPIEKWL